MIDFGTGSTARDIADAILSLCPSLQHDAAFRDGLICTAEDAHSWLRKLRVPADKTARELDEMLPRYVFNLPDGTGRVHIDWRGRIYVAGRGPGLPHEEFRDRIEAAGLRVWVPWRLR